MAKIKSKINKAKSKIIEDNFLQQDPDGIAETKALPIVAVVKEMPKMETIIFRNDRDPGMPLEFHYHTKTHRLHHYKLLHGKQYTLPLEVIEHLENRCIPIYGYRQGADDHPEMFIKSYKYQFTCKNVRDSRAA
jgi:hypothetical protein